MAEELDRRAQILEAAFEEFSAKGFKGATIKSIARAAGLQSPALIYWYFPDKEALFNAVLTTHAPLRGAIEDPASLMDRPPEEVLPMLATAHLDSFDDPAVVRLLRISLSESALNPGAGNGFIEGLQKTVLGFFVAYLRRQIELGRLRPHDVRSSARVFIGMLIPQLAGKLFFPALVEDGLTDDEHLKAAVELFLRGLRPEG